VKLTFYKIYDTRLDLYSHGGSDAAKNDHRGWGKKGKTWHGIGPLRLHLNHVITNGGGIPDTWEVIEFEAAEISRKKPVDHIKPSKLIQLLSKEHKRK
jgi:hypothetical protein